MKDLLKDPSVLTDGQLLHICAMAFEEHAERIFVYARDGRRLIDELRKRAAGTDAPTKTDVVEEELQGAVNGEVVIRVPRVRHRTQRLADSDWFPNPIPGRTNIRFSVVDENGDVTDMELGNAMPALAYQVSTHLMDTHADDLKRRARERP